MLVLEDKRTNPSLIPVGSVFGRLTATTDFEMRARPDGRNRAYQKFLCECGTFIDLVPYSVKSGNTSSCGCLHKEQLSALMKTHGLSKTSAYRVKLNNARRAQKRAATFTDDVDKVTAQVLSEILEEYSNTCWICEVTLDIVQWDHVHPLSRGGPHTKNNLRPSCKDCNSRKGAIWPFTEAVKDKIANDVRALRTSQALPLTDRKEVLDACHQ